MKMKSILLIIGVIIAHVMQAQPSPPVDPTPLPGIAILAVAGVALGSKKLMKSFNKNN